jgi:DNA-binding transcriptional regulator YhcF (GntR family)
MAGDEGAALRVKPLYRGVREALVRRIAEGVWQPGQVLPSEFEIAADLGVSQGTVRKALDEMTAERLVVRRQGRGTYVARHDDERILFQFFKLTPDSGDRRFPESRVLGVERLPADARAAERLGVPAGEGLVAIERVRFVGGIAAIVERRNPRPPPPRGRALRCEALAEPRRAFKGSPDSCAGVLRASRLPRIMSGVAPRHEEVKRRTVWARRTAARKIPRTQNAGRGPASRG